MTATLSRYLYVTIASLSICFASLSVQADEFDALRDRVRAARTQNDLTKTYQSIERDFRGETTKIVEFLQSVGFSCQYGSVFFKARCMFAYCGDRALFLILDDELLPPFRKELMSKGISITDRGVFISIVGHQSACPETEASLIQIQNELLTGGAKRDRK